MVATKTLVVHLTVVLAVLLCSFDSTTANQKCKDKLMKIVMNYCSNGYRRKRDLAEAQLKYEPKSGAEEIRSELHRQPVKRQTAQDSMVGVMTNAMPWIQRILKGLQTLNGQVLPSGMSNRVGGMLEAIPVLNGAKPQENPTSPQLIEGLSPEMGGFVKTFAIEDNLDFDLTSEEVDEISVMVMNNRIARHAAENPEDIKKQIMKAAARCCQNEEYCQREHAISQGICL